MLVVQIILMSIELDGFNKRRLSCHGGDWSYETEANPVSLIVSTAIKHVLRAKGKAVSVKEATCGSSILFRAKMKILKVK